jgi:hypothetical protein
MLRFSSMAMQQSGKGAGDSDAASRAASTLSDEQAEEFAASFTPAWDVGDDASGPANATLVDAPAMNATEAAAVVQAAPPAAAPAFHPKQTLIGTAPQANAPATHATHAARGPISSAEAIEPENILDSRTAPQPEVRAAAPAPATKAPQTSLKGTQIMPSSPAQMDARKAQSRPPPPGPAPAAKRAGAVAVTADPFAASARSGPARRARPQSEELDDFVPKKSSKTLYLVLAGLVFAGALGLFLKFALSEDPKPAPVEQHATGPAVTTAEIPPPPPKVDTAAPAITAAATAATATKVEAQPPPATLPAPQVVPQPARPTEPPAHVAAAPPQPRQRVTPPQPAQPAAAAAPPAPPSSPKTAPKPANGSIVRDNPF